MFAALGSIFRPLKNIAAQFAGIQEVVGTLKRGVFVTEEHKELFSLPLPPRKTIPHSGKMVFLDHFRLDIEANTLIEASNLEFGLSKTIAIVGPNGSGKSSLVKSFSGLISPQAWQANILWKDLIGRVSLVSQTPFLFDAPLSANLTYGSVGAYHPDHLHARLSSVGILDEISRFDQGLDTHIRPFGRNLSGGQLQRLALARGLLRKNKDIIIVDEVTSAVDSRADEQITLELMKICKNEKKSLIFVTHRLGLLPKFDEVWFVENGKVRLCGSHESLLADSRYAQFVGSL